LHANSVCGNRQPGGDRETAATSDTDASTALQSPCGPSEEDLAELELLSRAIRDGDNHAWEQFFAHYRGLVLSHIRKQSSFAVSENENFWVGRTFQRFAMAIGPGGLHRFTSPAAVTQYLKLCAASVLLDEMRSQRRAPHRSLDLLAETAAPGPQVEESVVDGVVAEELWAAVLQELPDESERLIARLSLQYGHKPAEIHARHCDRFPTVNDVYRTKRNMIDRLRRSTRLRQLLRGK
jgi:hypothetical protein